MQSMWTTTLHKGDIVKIPQNTHLFRGTSFFVPDKPIYGIITEEVEGYYDIMVNGENWLAFKDEIYPGR